MRGKAIRAANAFEGLPALVAGKRDKQGVLLVRAAAAERVTLFPHRGNRAAARCAPRVIDRMRRNAVARAAFSLANLARLSI